MSQLTPPPLTPALVAAADYFDALVVARRIKTGLCVGLWFVLGTALSLFVLLRYVAHFRALILPPVEPTGTVAAAAHVASRAVLQYTVGLLDFAGLVLPLVLVGVTIVILLVQLAARTVGAGHTTAAVAWSLLLAVLLFPWQAVLNNPAINADQTQDALGLKVPGVVPTWAELSHPEQGAAFVEVTGRRPGEIDTRRTMNRPPPEPAVTDVAADGKAKFIAMLHWARYAAFPIVAMVIVALVHSAVERGLRLSFGTSGVESVGVGEGAPAAASDA